MSSPFRTSRDGDGTLIRQALAGCILTMLTIMAFPGCVPRWLEGEGERTGPAAPRSSTAEEREELYRTIAGISGRPEGSGTVLRTAYGELRRHLARYPGDRDLAEMEALEAALRQAVADGELLEHTVREAAEKNLEGEKLREQADRLSRESETLKARIVQLETENGELRAIVERLKAIDIDMEEKRKRIR